MEKSKELGNLIWNEDSVTFFESHFNSHHGEVLIAINFIKEYVSALNNGGQILYRLENKEFYITNLVEFREQIIAELSDPESIIEFVFEE